MNSFTMALLVVLCYVPTILLLQKLIVRGVELQVGALEGQANLASSKRAKVVIWRATTISYFIVLGGMGVCLFDDPSPNSTQVAEFQPVLLVVSVALLVFWASLWASLKYKTFFKYFS